MGAEETAALSAEGTLMGGRAARVDSGVRLGGVPAKCEGATRWSAFSHHLSPIGETWTSSDACVVERRASRALAEASGALAEAWGTVRKLPGRWRDARNLLYLVCFVAQEALTGENSGFRTVQIGAKNAAGTRSASWRKRSGRSGSLLSVPEASREGAVQARHDRPVGGLPRTHRRRLSVVRQP